MTKEEIKAKYLEPIALLLEKQWHSQETHKMAVGAYWLDQLGVKDQAKRTEFLNAWNKTPSAFGSNCSALGQSLGRETGKQKIERVFNF